jgi:hypothetical protein
VTNFNDFSLVFLYGVQLLSQVAINHYILITVLLEYFYDNILFMIFMNTGCDNFDISVLNNTTCIIVHYSSLYILYSLMTAYLKAATYSCWFSLTNTSCVR